MKCPKCHSEVEKGSLYCPKCLTEIPWVKDFDSVETLMEKKKREEPPEAPDTEGMPKKKLRPRNKKEALVLCAVVVVLILLFCYRQLHTFPSLYKRAEKAFAAQDYDYALNCAQEALDRRPKNLAANILLAKILERQGDAMSAIMVLKPMMQQNPSDVGLYGLMVRLLWEEDRQEDITKLLKSCENEDILEACKEYICDPPVSSLAPGTYTSVQQVMLSADYDNIYYTLDGTEPTQNSARYTDPITLSEGTTVLTAMGVNDKNMPSDTISRKYVIVLRSPDEPEITPEAGIYQKDTKIEIKVPDGCRAYYAFDEIPDLTSTEYEHPIAMPQGAHTFHAVLVAANGKTSEVASRDYVLEYD